MKEKRDDELGSGSEGSYGSYGTMRTAKSKKKKAVLSLDEKLKGNIVPVEIFQDKKKESQ